MKIGIIGPALSCGKIKEHLMAIAPEAELSLYIREVAADAIEVIEACEEDCEAVIFSGDAVCQGVVSRHTMKRPYEFISKGGISLSIVFRQLQLLGLPLDHFSIDVVEPQVLDDVLCELNPRPQNIHTAPYHSYREQDYIKWHLQLWEEKKTSVIITSFVHIYHELKEQGYPVFYLPVTRVLVRSCYDKLKTRLALSEAKYAQIAVELIRLDDISDNAENYYSRMTKRCEAESLMIEYVRTIQASLFNQGPHEYVLFTSRGCVENRQNYIALQQLQKKVSVTGFSMYTGIGFGLTAYKAETNAKKALSFSLREPDTPLFLVNENDELCGPLLDEKIFHYPLVSSDAAILELSKKLELSCDSIMRLASIIEMRKSDIFDAAQLADCLNISIRSARRIMQKLIAAGAGTVYAKESSASGGRPKSLIRITLKKNEKTSV